MDTTLFIVIVIILLILVAFVIPRYLFKRALSRVIRIFREQGAFDVKSARTVDELGLRPRAMLQGMFKGRDYKPYALDILRKADIVQMTQDDRLYLSEEKFASSRFNVR